MADFLDMSKGMSSMIQENLNLLTFVTVLVDARFALIPSQNPMPDRHRNKPRLLIWTRQT